MPIGLPELIIIFIIVLLIFGAGRLAGLGRGLGQAIRGFKDEIGPHDENDDLDERGDRTREGERRERRRP
jgi:sec-independent protein translocase protein TatA